MEQAEPRRKSAPRVRFRVVAAALTLGGIGASLVAGGAANATSGGKTKNTVITTAKSTKLGTILVSGKTLYTLKADKTACTAKCLTIWPAIVLDKGDTKATAGTGVVVAKLGTAKLPGGALQVTYAGKALYSFVGDTAAGQVHGNNVTDTWGTWSVVVTQKPVVAAAPPGAATPTTSPSAGGSPAPTTAPTTIAPTSTTEPAKAPTTTTEPAKVPTTTTTDPGSGGVAF